MAKQIIYYASPEDMLMRTNGSIGVDWVEVIIVGTQNAPDRSPCFILVESLDGAKRFTVSENHIFIKTNGGIK